MLLLWTENLRVGVEEFDEDHKSLIGLVNGLHAAIEAGNGNKTVGGVLDYLDRYARVHCAREEMSFKQTGYREAAAHMREHDQLRRMIVKLKRRFESGPDDDFPQDVMNLIYIWLTNHIHSTDRKYGEYVRPHGLFQAMPESSYSGCGRGLDAGL